MEIRLNEGLVVFEADTDTVIGGAELKELINDAGFTLRGMETRSPNAETNIHEE